MLPSSLDKARRQTHANLRAQALERAGATLRAHDMNNVLSQALSKSGGPTFPSPSNSGAANASAFAPAPRVPETPPPSMIDPMGDSGANAPLNAHTQGSAFSFLPRIGSFGPSGGGILSRAPGLPGSGMYPAPGTWSPGGMISEGRGPVTPQQLQEMQSNSNLLHLLPLGGGMFLHALTGEIHGIHPGYSPAPGPSPVGAARPGVGV